VLLGGVIMAEDFSFEITESIGLISESKSGWKFEVNKVSWGGRPAKYDIRSWSPDHQKMGKGITLSDEEIKKLGEIIGGLSL
jgi:hypothetical protein